MLAARPRCAGHSVHNGHSLVGSAEDEQQFGRSVLGSGSADALRRYDRSGRDEGLGDLPDQLVGPDDGANPGFAGHVRGRRRDPDAGQFRGDQPGDGFTGPVDVVNDPELERWLRLRERARPDEGRKLRACCSTVTG